MSITEERLIVHQEAKRDVKLYFIGDQVVDRKGVTARSPMLLEYTLNTEYYTANDHVWPSIGL